MSATLRHEVGVWLTDGVPGVPRPPGPRRPTYPIGTLRPLLERLNLRRYQKYTGYGRPPSQPPSRYPARDVLSFRLRLPGDLEDYYRLIRGLAWCRDKTSSIFLLGGIHTLLAKLCCSLGLPVLSRPGDDERGFLKALDQNPGDLTTWGAYADWLSDRGDLRGELIRGWLAPRPALKVNRGVPVIATDDYRKASRFGPVTFLNGFDWAPEPDWVLQAAERAQAMEVVFDDN